MSHDRIGQEWNEIFQTVKVTMFPLRYSYTQEDMKRAIALVKNGMVLSVAAKSCGIPRTSLIKRVYGTGCYGNKFKQSSGRANYRCWMCPSKFNTAALLKMHMVAAPHCRLKVVCPFCLEKVITFVQPQYLKRHVQRTHGDKVISRLPRDFFTERACYYLAVYPDDYKRFVKPIHSTSTAAKTAIDIVLQWHETLVSPIKTIEAWLNQWETHNSSGARRFHDQPNSQSALPETDPQSESQTSLDSPSVSTAPSSSTEDSSIHVDQSASTNTSSGNNVIATSSLGIGTHLTPPTTPPLSTPRTATRISQSESPTASSTTTSMSRSTSGFEERGRLSCETCYRRFEFEADLRMHRRVHVSANKRKLFKCSHCDKRFMYLSNYNGHQITCQGRRLMDDTDHVQHQYGTRYASFDPTGRGMGHNGETRLKQTAVTKEFPCDKCSMGFRSKSALTYHRTKHTTAAYACPLCGTPITRYFNVRYHVHNTHKITLEDLAKKGNEKAEQLIINKNMVNRVGAKPIICCVCWRGFESKDSFRRHIEKHKSPELKEHRRSRDLYKCTMCNVEVEELIHLKNHVVCAHNEDSGETSRVGNLQKLVHIPKTFNGTPYAIITLIPIISRVERSKAKATSSTQRNVTTASKYSATGSTTKTGIIRPHELITASQIVTSQYKCDICGYQFASRDNLVRHIKIHINSSEKRNSKFTPIRSRKGYAKVGLQHEDIDISVLGEDVRDVANGTVVYRCKVCLSKFDTERDLFKHLHEMADHHCTQFMKKVSDLLFASLEPKRKRLYWTCDICGLFYTVQRSLYAHRRRKHGMLQSESTYSEQFLQPYKIRQVAQSRPHEQRIIQRSLHDNLVTEADSTASNIPCGINNVIIDNPEEHVSFSDICPTEDNVTQATETVSTDVPGNVETFTECTTSITHVQIDSNNKHVDPIKTEVIEIDFEEAPQIENYSQEYIEESQSKDSENTLNYSDSQVTSNKKKNVIDFRTAHVLEQEMVVDSQIQEESSPGDFGAVSVDRLCLKCEETIMEGEPSLSCQLCCQTFCIGCSELSSEVLATIRRGPSTGLMWMCSVCRPNFPAYLGLLGQLAQFEDVLNKRFSQVSDRLTGIEENAEVLGNVIKESN